MIKIFRKIRQNLLAEGKTGQYLKYAIGEIILVVIGILIALQINNWEETRINNFKETKILLDLKSEFENNLKSSKNSLEFNLNSNKACLALAHLIDQNEIQAKSFQVDSLIGCIIDFSAFEAKTGTTDEIINSGKLNLIGNEQVRNQLTLWSGILRNAEGDYNYRFDNYTHNLIPFLMSHFPMSNVESNKRLTSSKGVKLEMYPKRSRFSFRLNDEDLMKFENQIWHHKHNQDYVILNDYNIQDFIETTIQLLEQELVKD